MCLWVLYNIPQHSIPKYPHDRLPRQCMQEHLGQVRVSMYWCSYVWAGERRMNRTPQLWVSSGIPALHSQHHHRSSVSPSSHCTVVAGHGFNYPYFRFFWVIPLSVIFVNWTLAARLLCKWWTEGQRGETNCPKTHRNSMAKWQRTVKHMNYLSNLLFKWGCVHRSKWNAEQWKLEPDNLLTQNSAACTHWLIFQFDFSLLALCCPQDDPPWSQQDCKLEPQSCEGL